MPAKDHITYRTKTAEEVEIASHLSACAQEFVPPLSNRVDIKAYAAKIYANAVTFEAWHGQNLIGLIACYFNLNTQQGYITNVSVNKEFQSLGIAASLLQKNLEHAEQFGLKLIRLEVNRENERAIQFYKKYGFNLDETTTDSLFMKISVQS